VRSRARHDRGQASVEVALLLPVVAALALVVVQVTVVAHRSVLVVHAAREGARAAAVSEVDRHRAAIEAAERAGGLARDRLEVTTDEVDGQVAVEVRYREPTDVALIGHLLPVLTLRARTTMGVEEG
jgi:Flp pilus assembly protein TadG